MVTPLVRNGGDWKHPRDGATGATRHTIGAVYPEMVLQICMQYPGLPDVRTLTLSEIRFFYNGIRKTLHELTKPKPKA